MEMVVWGSRWFSQDGAVHQLLRGDSGNHGPLEDLANLSWAFAKFLRLKRDDTTKHGKRRRKGKIRPSQMLNVWPIYLHLGSFGDKCR